MLPKTPSFWQSDNVLSRILLPLSCFYLLGHKIKICCAKPYVSTLPVLCVGGVIAGGSGKTPVTHALLKLIRNHELFVNPIILTRGYGGKLKGPTTVDSTLHTAEDVGDEALLHSRHAVTIVSKNRMNGAKLAEAMGADLIILDDGLQNSSLQKTLSLLVASGFGNGRLIPAGPLREPLDEAMNKCGAVIPTDGLCVTDKPVITTSLRILSDHDKTKTYFGFAGLGNPEKFKKTLEDNNFKLSGFKPFPDHNPYSAADMHTLSAQAGAATLITTEKDFVRVPKEFQNKIDVLRIELSFNKPDILLNLFKTELS